MLTLWVKAGRSSDQTLCKGHLSNLFDVRFYVCQTDVQSLVYLLKIPSWNFYLVGCELHSKRFDLIKSLLKKEEGIYLFKDRYLLGNR
jgi:hypothetical protein